MALTLSQQNYSNSLVLLSGTGAGQLAFGFLVIFVFKSDFGVRVLRLFKNRKVCSCSVFWKNLRGLVVAFEIFCRVYWGSHWLWDFSSWGILMSDPISLLVTGQYIVPGFESYLVVWVSKLKRRK